MTARSGLGRHSGFPGNSKPDLSTSRRESDQELVGLFTESGLQAMEAGVQTGVDVFAGSGYLIPAAM